MGLRGRSNVKKMLSRADHLSHLLDDWSVCVVLCVIPNQTSDLIYDAQLLKKQID
jgi:hypothetical protein